MICGSATRLPNCTCTSTCTCWCGTDCELKHLDNLGPHSVRLMMIQAKWLWTCFPKDPSAWHSRHSRGSAKSFQESVNPLRRAFLRWTWMHSYLPLVCLIGQLVIKYNISIFKFIVACASGLLEENQLRWSEDRPEILPAALTDSLGTPAQKLW